MRLVDSLNQAQARAVRKANGPVCDDVTIDFRRQKLPLLGERSAQGRILPVP